MLLHVCVIPAGKHGMLRLRQNRSEASVEIDIC